MSKEDVERLRAQGLEVETVADILGDTGSEPVADPILPPRHEGQPEFPAPGIYFGMPEEVYHSIPAASNSHLKRLSVSSMDAWADSWMNLDREEPEDKPHFNFGKAIHAFVLEGEAVYVDRYAVDLEYADYADENPIVHTEQIKAAIGQFTEPQPVKPVAGGKQALIDQLAELHRARGDTSFSLDGNVNDLKERIRTFLEDAPIKPVLKIEEDDGEGGVTVRPAVKSDWIDQLVSLSPDVKIWDRMVAQHRANHDGKLFIDALTDRRVRIAAKMILSHPQIKQAIEGGWPEVSVFWHCKKTGIPMKARFDMLKMRLIADLKSFANKVGKPIRSAINTAIASYRYNMQHVVYVEAAMAARELIRQQIENGEALDAVIHNHAPYTPGEDRKVIEWCEKWASQVEPPEFLFIFQQTGIAPVTRGRIMPRSMLYSVTRSRVEELKRFWLECAQTYGTDPWLDIAPIETTEDEEIPEYATDIGKVEL